MQLAFSETDRAVASDERLADLLAQAHSSLSSDPVRSLYYANEALLFAESLQRSDAELTALRAVIAAMQAGGRTTVATPYVARAIELAEQSPDPEVLDELVALLGNWAIEVERQPGTRPSGRRRTDPQLPWLLTTIARLEQALDQLQAPVDVSEAPEVSLSARRPELVIEDEETGLLNARGMTLELLRLEDRQSIYALIQIAVRESDLAEMKHLAETIVHEVGNTGVVARNGDCTLTAILPGATGMAALMLAERLRTSLARDMAGQRYPIGIGVSVKQPTESSHDVLRRVVERRDEALSAGGITVVG